MKICGIISEYNPFHNGHLYHINKTKELTNCDAIVCVLSGNFVQRGMPAMIDKWTRAQLALLNGVDLVLELPTLYAVSSAEFFSFGAVSLLDSLGVIDSISFGSELGNVDFLNEISRVLLSEPKDFFIPLKENLAKGISYALSRNNALENYFKNISKHSKDDLKDLSSILNSSNNILGIEYCKSILKLNSSITPFTIKREGGDYNSSSLNNLFSSATSIRNKLKKLNSFKDLENAVPLNVIDALKNCTNYVYPDEMLPYIRHKAFSNPHSIEDIPEASEGLHNRILRVLEDNDNYDRILNEIKSKRYSMTRISRILCQLFIGFDNYDIKNLRKEPCPYGRVLGFNDTGREILRNLKSTSSIPIYTKLPKATNEVLNLDIQSTKAYSLLDSSISPKDDFLKMPIILNNRY
ncbi:MAG: nucleotidyltransferase [Clostridium sp.]